MGTVRKIILVSTFLAIAGSSYAEDAHHPTVDPTTVPLTEPTPRIQPDLDMMSGGMMSMMGRMGTMMDPSHIEGRIAFLKTELKITEAQQRKWEAFAEVMRGNAQDMGGMMNDMQTSMMPTATSGANSLIQRIDGREHTLHSQLEYLEKAKAALLPLYESLDEAQKRAADELLMPGPMGMM